MPPAEPTSEASLRELYELRNLVDELIEEGLIHRWSVSEVLATLLPRVGQRLGIEAAFVETYGEDLDLHLFGWTAAGAPLVIPEHTNVMTRTSDERRERVMTEGEHIVVAQHL